MGGRIALGAASGLWSGLAVVGVLILLPRLQDGDFYEVGDPLVYLGVPVLALFSAGGAGVGAALGWRRRQDQVSTSPSTLTMTLGAGGLVLTAALLVWGTS